jgi:quercetin dioxygenase-like cupin family protein
MTAASPLTRQNRMKWRGRFMQCRHTRTLLRGLFAGAGLVAAISLCIADATHETPQPILPEALEWSSPPTLGGVRGAWIIGAEGRAGTYVFRVQLAADARIPPHTHPDTRYTTVLSGTLQVGFGTDFDPDQTVAIPAGAVYVAPAGTPHYIWARDGAVEYQEAGIGPTATQLVK